MVTSNIQLFNPDITQSPDMLPLHEVKAPTEPEKSENGYVTVLKWASQQGHNGEARYYCILCRNLPFFLVMLANLPAVMGLYIPYMYLPGVRTYYLCDKS